MKRLLVRGLLAVVAVVFVAGAYVMITLARARGGLPEWDVDVQVAGLAAPVEVLRDEHGVPFLRASSERDLYFAQRLRARPGSVLADGADPPGDGRSAGGVAGWARASGRPDGAYLGLVRPCAALPRNSSVLHSCCRQLEDLRASFRRPPWEPPGPSTTERTSAFDISW